MSCFGHIEHTYNNYEDIWAPCLTPLVPLGSLIESLLPRLVAKSNLGAKRLTGMAPTWPQFSLLGGRFATFEGLGCNVRLLLFSLSGFDGVPMILPDTLDICLNGFARRPGIAKLGFDCAGCSRWRVGPSRESVSVLM